jgi:glycosyltransferase involved in cell wall biosynthesis
MANPVISIVLPTYNGARYIRQSIDSCLAQTFKDFELIVVNDCSTDGTAAIIEEYADKDSRVRVIHNKFNKKLPLSLNTGFDAAIGTYHTWTSDDNYYAPTALETMLACFLQSGQELGLVYSDYTIIDDAGSITGTRTFNNIYDGFANWLGCGACFLYKEEVYKANNGYNPSAFLIEDYDFFMRAFLKFQFKYHPSHALYYYREHASSLTSTQGDNVNYLSKMMVERQMPLFEQKLPKNQLALLYRKFAVFNAVQKNNTAKYALYLGKLWSISKKQTLITLCFVPLQKLWLSISVSANGLLQFVKLMGRRS